MSVVTTLIIATSIMESEEDHDENDIFPSVDHINAAMGDRRVWLKQVDQHAGGNKAPQAYVFMGAINNLDLDAFKAHMRSAPWQEPDSVMLLVSGEEELGFHVEPWQ